MHVVDTANTLTKKSLNFLKDFQEVVINSTLDAFKLESVDQARKLALTLDTELKLLQTETTLDAASTVSLLDELKEYYENPEKCLPTAIFEADRSKLALALQELIVTSIKTFINQITLSTDAELELKVAEKVKQQEIARLAQQKATLIFSAALQKRKQKLPLEIHDALNKLGIDADLELNEAKFCIAAYELIQNIYAFQIHFDLISRERSCKMEDREFKIQVNILRKKLQQLTAAIKSLYIKHMKFSEDYITDVVGETQIERSELEIITYQLQSLIAFLTNNVTNISCIQQLEDVNKEFLLNCPKIVLDILNDNSQIESNFCISALRLKHILQTLIKLNEGENPQFDTSGYLEQQLAQFTAEERIEAIKSCINEIGDLIKPLNINVSKHTEHESIEIINRLLELFDRGTLTIQQFVNFPQQTKQLLLQQPLITSTLIRQYGLEIDAFAKYPSRLFVEMYDHNNLCQIYKILARRREQDWTFNVNTFLKESEVIFEPIQEKTQKIRTANLYKLCTNRVSLM